MNVKHLILGCLMTLCSGAGISYAQNEVLCDSLAVVAEKLPHDESRLKALYKLIFLSQDDVDTCRHYTDQLLAEADLQHNPKYTCKAMFVQIVIAYNTYDAKQVKIIADQLIPLARKEGQFDLMFRTWRCMIDMMILTQDYERNEREALKMLSEARNMNNTTGILEAYQCLANIYCETFRQHKAIPLLEESIQLATQMGEFSVLINTWRALIVLYSETHEFTKWFSTLTKFERYFMEHKNNNSKIRQSLFFMLYASYADYYMQLGDLENAGHYLEKSKPYYTDIDSPLYSIYYDQISAEYYQATKQYEKALEQINLAIATLGKLSRNTSYNNLRLIRSEILYNLGRSAEAEKAYREGLAFRDSLHVVSINKQYEQLKKDFNADQLLLEGARMRHRMQIWMLILLGAGLFTAVFFVVYMRRAHSALHRAAEEMRTMAHTMELANEAKNQFLSNMSTTIRKPLNLVVEGSLRLVENRVKSPEQRQHLAATIRKMSATLLKTINNILDLSRLEAGMMRFEIADIEILSTLYDATCATETPQNRIEIHARVSKNSLFFARMDANRVMQAFKSLLIANKGTGTVSATVSTQGEALELQFVGSALAQEKISQEDIICNEINRMLFVHFGGSYELCAEQTKITITLPANEIQTNADNTQG